LNETVPDTGGKKAREKKDFENKERGKAWPEFAWGRIPPKGVLGGKSKVKAGGKVRVLLEMPIPGILYRETVSTGAGAEVVRRDQLSTPRLFRGESPPLLTVSVKWQTMTYGDRLIKIKVRK